MDEIRNSRDVKLTDRVRFRCMRCGKCCRHVKNTVILHSIDAYFMAKLLNITVAEFYEQYADTIFLEDTGYPLMVLKAKGKEQSCIFLKGNRCVVQKAKPQVCRLYPFWIEPDDKTQGQTFLYHLSTEQTHHPRGSLIKVKDGMAENLTDDCKAFWKEEWCAMQYLAPLIKEANKTEVRKEELLFLLLEYRYYNFETDKPFHMQHRQNNYALKYQLEQRIRFKKG